MHDVLPTCIAAPSHKRAAGMLDNVKHSTDFKGQTSQNPAPKTFTKVIQTYFMLVSITKYNV